MSFRKDRCCNPFRRPGEKGHVGKDLRNVPLKLREKYSKIAKICTDCRKMLYTKRNEETNSSDHESCCSSDSNASSIAADNDISPREAELEEILNGIKQVFNSLSKNDPERIKLLTLAPLSWSIRKISKEFECSRYTAEVAKNLRINEDIWSSLSARAGKKLPPQYCTKSSRFLRIR